MEYIGIILQSDELGQKNEDLENGGNEQTRQNRYLNAYAFVKGIREENDRKHLLFDRPFLTPYLKSNNSRVSIFNPKTNIVICSLVFEGTQRQLGDEDEEWTAEERSKNADINQIRMRRIAKAFIYNNEFLHFRKRGMLLNKTFGISVYENTIHDSTDFDGGVGGTVCLFKNHKLYRFTKIEFLKIQS